MSKESFVTLSSQLLQQNQPTQGGDTHQQSGTRIVQQCISTKKPGDGTKVSPDDHRPLQPRPLTPPPPRQHRALQYWAPPQQRLLQRAPQQQEQPFLCMHTTATVTTSRPDNSSNRDVGARPREVRRFSLLPPTPSRLHPPACTLPPTPSHLHLPTHQYPLSQSLGQEDQCLSKQ